jgi:hypothetical protein
VVIRFRKGLRLRILSEVFLRHNANETFVLQLLHRHFDMDPNEKLVEYGPVQNPWPVAADQEFVQGGHVLPKSWRMYNDELHPFEFQFFPATEQPRTPVFTKAFVNELRDVLRKTGLDNIVGISLTDPAADSKPDDLVEITIGRNSMMVPAGKAPAEGVDSTVAAAWSFSRKADKNAQTARWCRHAEPAKDVDTARWCRHAEPAKDEAAVARWCRHAEPVKDEAKVETARWCRHAEPAKDETDVARWCRHAEPVKDEAKVDTARWCRHAEPAKDETNVARWCRHAEPAKDETNVARWCRHAEPAKDAAKDEASVARWCRHAEPAKDETNVARWCRHAEPAKDGDATTL